jgi:hypothetical protein
MRSALLALVLALALPVTASAQVVADGDEQVVGPGQVVTDPASETEDPAADEGEDPADDTGEEEEADAPAASEEPAAPSGPKRGEIHVLGARDASSETASTESAARELPFTGVDAGPLFAIGIVLLGAGLALRRPYADAC